MENKKRPGRAAGAMEGKGFYIVLFLCAAVIGASAWIFSAGTHVEDNDSAEITVDISDAVVTMLPAGTRLDDEDAVAAAAIREEETEEAAEELTEAGPEDDAAEVMSEAVVTYIWPVRGQVEVPFAVETLLYDATMSDWRTHAGIDIACSVGDEVLATADGIVESIEEDDLYGTTVRIDHENGLCSVYSNLAKDPPVSEGEYVNMGQVIGSVGGTALAETNVVPHLHLAMSQEGRYVDPRLYLPETADE